MNKMRLIYFEKEDIIHLIISDEPEANSVELEPIWADWRIFATKSSWLTGSPFACFSQFGILLQFGKFPKKTEILSRLNVLYI